MELIDGITALDTCLFLKKEKVLVIADLHIGIEEALNKEGILVPRFQLERILTKLNKIIKKIKPEKIIINGDLKHGFGKPSEQEWRDTLKIIDYLLEHTKEIILIKGNHDNILGQIARKRDLSVIDNIQIGDINITHGDKIRTSSKSKTIIIGHEHPAISIRDKLRTETYKCFLVGKWRRKNLIVMPSFNLVTQGTDILKEKLISPYLKNIDDFKVFVIGDKIYDFDKVGSL